MHTESDHTSNRRISVFLSWLGGHELSVMIVILLITGGIWLFVELADEMLEGDTHEFDEKLIMVMRNPRDPSDPIGPKWLEEFGRDVTALGGVGILGMLTVSVAGFLILQGKRQAAVFVIAAVAGGLIISSLLKTGFDRPRPDLVPHGAYTYTASFPSGHSTMSAVTFLTLGALLARVQRRRRVKAYLIILALILTTLVGVSRVYLGVHWPTDVLAGWTLGTTWALICWLVARWLQKRGKVEKDSTGDA